MNDERIVDALNEINTHLKKLVAIIDKRTDLTDLRSIIEREERIAELTKNNAEAYTLLERARAVFRSTRLEFEKEIQRWIEYKEERLK